jgi:hypothetical protein
LAEGARRTAESRHSPAHHTAKLLELLRDVTSAGHDAVASHIPVVARG